MKQNILKTLKITTGMSRLCMPSLELATLLFLSLQTIQNSPNKTQNQRGRLGQVRLYEIASKTWRLPI